MKIPLEDVNELYEAPIHKRSYDVIRTANVLKLDIPN
jgi:hypothetical protein